MISQRDQSLLRARAVVVSMIPSILVTDGSIALGFVVPWRRVPAVLLRFEARTGVRLSGHNLPTRCEAAALLCGRERRHERSLRRSIRDELKRLRGRGVTWPRARPSEEVHRILQFSRVGFPVSGGS